MPRPFNSTTVFEDHSRERSPRSGEGTDDLDALERAARLKIFAIKDPATGAFGGRDHTTVLHACRRVKLLRETETRIAEDYGNLLRTLTG